MPTFLLGKSGSGLSSVSYALLLLLLLFLLPFSNAVYNDVGNDSCLTVYSDSSVYRANNLSKPNTIEVYLTLENKCGLPITANVGLLVESKHKALVGIAKAVIEKDVISSKPTDDVLAYVPGTKVFETKIGWEAVALKDGNTSIVLDLVVPKEEGEFAITAFNPLNPAQRSILDPSYLGAGTKINPYKITTCVELQDMNYHTNDLTVYFELTQNIDCSATKTWLGVGGVMKGFDPIGTGAAPFKGHLDGNHWAIQNLTIYRTAEGAALFGYAQNADINNLGFIDINIYSTNARIGAVIGSSNGKNGINTVYVKGGQITGNQYTGGIIGLGDTDDLNQVYTKDVNINNSADNDIGGLTGFLGIGTLWNCYSTSRITTTGINNGGLVGRHIGGSATSSYWNPTDSIVIVSALGTEKTQAQMKQAATYTGWDFVDTWTTYTDTNTPQFQHTSGPPGPPYVPPTPSLSFVSIDGKAFVYPTQTFAYLLDGNLQIDFNVFVNDNNRLMFDINYSTSPNVGTGTVIVNDLNLTSAFCSDQDWFDVPSVCHWDFNIQNAADGNYYLVGNLYRQDVNYFKPSPTTFIIANDVNIVVAVPIDEETGLPINTISKYRWTVRIYAADGLQYYPNQIDKNGFMAPIGSQIIVEIDTNTSDFYPRQYSLIFDSPTATYNLQPYLVKQAVSGNFIFNVTNLTTAAPISGVQIKIYGFIPALDTPNIQTISTDSAGLATIPLRLGSPYTVEFYYLGVLVHSASITPTTGSLYYQVQLNIAGTTPTPTEYGSLLVNFYPTSGYLYQKNNGAVDINLSITMLTKTLQQIRVQIFDSNGCRFDDNTFTGPWTDGNMVVFTNLDLNTGGSTNIHSNTPCKFDEQFSIWVQVDANSTDGNKFQAHSIKWQLVTQDNYKYNLLYLLPNLGASINGNNGKVATTFIAFLVLIVAVSAVGAVSGGEPIMAAMLTVAILGFFVLIGFVDFMPFAFICIATFFGILYMWRRFG